MIETKKDYKKFLGAWGKRYGLTLAQVQALQALWLGYYNANVKAANGDRFFGTTDKDKASKAWEQVAGEAWDAMNAAAKELGFLGVTDEEWPSLMLPDRNVAVLPDPRDEE